MNTAGRILMVLGVVILLPACALQPTHPGAVTYHTLASGVHSGVYEAYFTVIRDPFSFKRIWERATARRLPAPSVPHVNFSRDIVIALFLGEHASTGYGIKVTDITQSPHTLHISVREQKPGATCDVDDKRVQPFQIIKVARRHVRVHFEQNVVTQHCD